MSDEVNRLLQEAISAAQAGDKVRAKRLLIEVTERDERNEQAWLWLSGVVDDLEETQICLENVLTINPSNQRAREGLAWVQSRLSQERPAAPPAAPVEPEAPPSYPEPAPWDTLAAPFVEPTPSAEEPISPWEQAPPFFEEPATPVEEGVSPFQGYAAFAEELPYEVEAPPSLAEQFAAAAAPSAAEQAEEPKRLENRVPCPSCGAMNFDFATECVKCGFPFTITCPSCGRFVTTETGFCPQCDAELPLPEKLPSIRARDAETEEVYREGLALLEAGDYQEAKAAFEEVLASEPQHVEARYSLGMVCSKLGLPQEALRHWEEVKRLYPDHPYVDKDLESLLSPRERRLLARERQKVEREKRKKEKETGGRPVGQALIAEYEKELAAAPPAEEEMGGGESFVYILIVGLVIGVTYGLNALPAGTELTASLIPLLLRQVIVITAILIVLWIMMGISIRLVGLVFRAKGSVGRYMVSASRFMMPFFLLIIPIVLSLPPVMAYIPDQVYSFLDEFPAGFPLVDVLPSPIWTICGGLALFWGLISYVRSIRLVGRIALWKSTLVGLVALALAVAIVGGAVYFGYGFAQDRGYLATLGFGPDVVIPTPPPDLEPEVPLTGQARNEAGGFGIAYPEGWSHVDIDTSTVIYQNEQDMEAALPASPIVRIESGPLGELADGGAVGTGNSQEMAAGVAETFRGEGVEVEIGQVRTIQVAGQDAAVVDIRGSGFDGTSAAGAARIVCIHQGERGIVVLGLAAAEAWDAFSPTFDAMIEEMTLFEATTPPED